MSPENVREHSRPTGTSSTGRSARTEADRHRSPGTLLARLQGAYFLLTGVWPLVDIDSFQVVTGPKTDLWLVRTVGALIAVVGAVLLVAAQRRNVSVEIGLLAVGTAFALLTVDVVYVAIGRIARVYLLDAAAETLLLAGWTTVVLCQRARQHSASKG